MRVRVLPILWCAASSVVASLLGAAGVALKTEAGRRVSVSAAIALANEHVHGRLSVGVVGGSWLGGLDARDVRLTDTTGATVVHLARLGATYQLSDLAGGRLTLGAVTLDTPVVHLVEWPSGRLNIEDILGIGGVGAKGSGPAPLIAFRDVIIRHGSVDIRTPMSPGDSAPVVDSSSGKRFRVRRVDGIDAVFPYVRVASPLPKDIGIRVDVQRLAARLSDPALDIRGAQGTVGIRGDTVALDLGDARLPHSVARVRGNLINARQGLGIDLVIQAANGASEDIRGLAPQVPPGVDGRGRFSVHQDPGGALTFIGEPVTLVGRDGGGTAAGRLGVAVGAHKAWAMRETRLTLDRFDLSYLRTLLDTLPIEGRVTGTFQANGDHVALTTDLDITFRDSLVAGWPVSTVQGGGLLHLGVPGDIVFDGFSVRAAHIDLATARRLITSMHLMGVIDAAGTLDGAWRNATFSGTIRHKDGVRPASLARGVVRVDARRDTIGVWANMRVDSLDLTGIASELRGLPVRGAFAGEIRLAGYLDSLAVQVDLTGPAGGIAARGAFTVLPPRVAVRDLDVTTHGFDLHALAPAWPSSSLNGHLTGQIATDTLTAPRATIFGMLSASSLGGAPLDSGRAVFSVHDSLFLADSVHVWGPGSLDIDVRGAIPMAGSNPADSLLIRVNTDSLQLLAPLLVTLAPQIGSLPDSVGGAVTVVASAHGNPHELVLRGAVATPSLRWGVATVRGVRVLGQWSSDVAVPLSIRAEGRTIQLGRFTFARPLLNLDGAAGALRWRARAGLGDDASLAAAGRWIAGGDSLTVPFDSLVLQLPDQAWRLDSLARITVRDSAVDLSHVTLRAATGPGEMALVGRHPRIGIGDVRVALTQVPLTGVWALLQRDPKEVAGLVTGTVGLHGELHTPQLTATLTVRDGRFGDFLAPRITTTLDYHDRRLTGAMDLYRDSTRIMDVGIDLPLDLALVAVAQRQLPGALSVRAHTDSLDLGFVETLSSALKATSGLLKANVGVTGSWDAPVLRGTIDVTDAAANLPSLGARYASVFAHLELSGDTVRVDSITAVSGDGSVAVSGTVRLVALNQPVLDLLIEADNFQAIDARSFLSLSGSGQLALKGPAIGARLTGHALVTKGVLYFADLLTKNVVNLDALDQELGDSTLRAAVEHQGLGQEFRGRFIDSLRVDALALDMGSEVWLRSSEANIALTGQVVVGKVGNKYRVDGTLETPRGSYRLPIPLGATTINRDFAVMRGRVQFFGTSDLNAALDVDAQHVVRTTKGENITTFVNIGGTLYVPKLTLTSDVRPAISETEIMSYLLVGAPSLGATGGAGSRALSEAAGILSGQLESTLISDLRVPLDFLAIRTGDAGSGLTGTEISAGWQVTRDVFLTFSPRLCPGQGALQNLGASLEYRFSHEWRFAFSRDPVRGCDFLVGLGSPVPYQVGFDLFWEKRY